MNNVYCTLVRTLRSRRRARSCAASEAFNRPQYRHTCTSAAKSSGSVLRRRGAANEPQHRILHPTVVDFDLRVNTISCGKVWIELECTIERGLRAGDRIRFASELAHDAVEMAQPCPGGCVGRIGLHGLLIQAARDG